MLFSTKKNGLLSILILIIFSDINFGQSGWVHLSSPVSENLTSVAFVDSQYGWAAGSAGTIIHTTNGGTNWIVQNSTTDNNIDDIFFINQTLGWAIFRELFNFPLGTCILKTTDGGENWMVSSNPNEKIFGQCMFFLDSLNGWIGGKPNPASMIRTTDGGVTWLEAEIDSSTYSNFPVFDIQFLNSDFGYASGGHVDCCGITWRTSNGGDNWVAADTPYIAPEPIYQLHIKDSASVIGAGGDFEALGFGVGIIRTQDSGTSWDFEYIGISGVAWDVDFRTENEVWAPLGGEMKLIFSENSGLTWFELPTPDSVMIFKICFPDSLHGFGVGSDGAIIKYIPDSTTSLQFQNNLSVDKFFLQQNYPNPFNTTTNINFQLSESRTTRLVVYDLLGNEIAVLMDEELGSGNYEITFDAGRLSSGIYFYKITSGDFISTKKMILLK